MKVERSTSKDKRRLKRLIDERGSFCELCKCKVQRISSIPIENRISVDHYFVKFIDKNKVIKVLRIATLEHVKRLSDGGTYDDENLLVACKHCNAKNNIEDQAFGSPKNRCRHCDRLFGKGSPRYHKSRSCYECHQKNNGY